jgi:hypothetical protein
MLGGVALGQPTSQVIDSLSTQLGTPVEIQSFLCGEQVPALVAEWGDLSAVFGTGSDSLHAFDEFVYNEGGWSAYQKAGNSLPPLLPGHVSSPLVETAGGATIGDTVRQVQELDPAADPPTDFTDGTPDYVDDGDVLFRFLSPSEPTAQISEIFESYGNC